MQQKIVKLFPAAVASQFNNALAEWSMWCHSPPTFVRKLVGGITNSSIVVSDDQGYYVLRINAFNSNALGLNRRLEKTIFQSAAQAAISSTLVYADPSERYLVCNYVHGRHLNSGDIGSPVSLEQLAQLVKKIHQLPAVQESLNVRSRIATYWQSIQRNHFAYDALMKLQLQVEPLINQALSTKTELCICHHDLLPENLILTEDGELLAIDWEYAAMGNPYFDLAVVIDGLMLNSQQSDALLASYFDTNQPDPELNQQLNYWRVIYHYISLLWYGVQCNQHGENSYRHAFTHSLGELEAFLANLNK